MQIEGGILGNAGVAKRLDNREIGVVELDVLADERDFDGWPWIAQVVHQLRPGRHVAFMIRELKYIQDFAA